MASMLVEVGWSTTSTSVDLEALETIYHVHAALDLISCYSLQRRLTRFQVQVTSPFLPPSLLLHDFPLLF